MAPGVKGLSGLSTPSGYSMKDQLRNHKVDKVQYRHLPMKQVTGLSHKAELRNQKVDKVQCWHHHRQNTRMEKPSKHWCIERKLQIAGALKESFNRAGRWEKQLEGIGLIKSPVSLPESKMSYHHLPVH
ncbi:uridylyltransferase [Sesbania bispinosa]|nr:uridylyltransferase [Sesbania bispinosa]